MAPLLPQLLPRVLQVRGCRPISLSLSLSLSCSGGSLLPMTARDDPSATSTHTVEIRTASSLSLLSDALPLAAASPWPLPGAHPLARARAGSPPPRFPPPSRRPREQSLDFEDCIDFGEEKAPSAMAALVASINKGGEGGAEAADGAAADDDDDEDDDDDDDGGPRVSIRTGLLDEKAAAAHCIGNCAKHSGAAFAPHVARCLESLLKAHDYFHEDVRGASCRALASLATATAKAEGVPSWTKGVASVSYTLGSNTRALLEQVVPVLLGHFRDDDDKDTVAAASEALSEICSLLGPAVATPLAPELVPIAVALLAKGHACMQDDEDDEHGAEADPDEDDDHDAALWEAVSDLLTMLPKVMGDYYLMHFARLVPELLPYLGAQHPGSDRSLAIGILAESLHQLELGGACYLPQVLPHAVRLSSDENTTARQNATFCLGILGQFGGPGALEVMQTILTALQPRLADTEDESVHDNAVSSLSRLVLAFGSALPLASLLPAIVGRLPLRADSGENLACCRAIMAVAQDEAARPGLAPHIPQVLGAFAELLTSGDKLATPELQAEVRQFLSWLLGIAPDLRAHLPAELQQAL